MKWEITDPETGRKMDYEGDRVPSKEEIDLLFGKGTTPSAPNRSQEQPMLPVSFERESLPSYFSRSPIVQDVSERVGNTVREIPEALRSGVEIATGPGRAGYDLGRYAAMRSYETAAPLVSAATAPARNAYQVGKWYAGNVLLPGLKKDVMALPPMRLGVAAIEAAPHLGAAAGRGLTRAEGAVRSWFQRNVVPPPIEGRISVISPDGRTGTVPAEELEIALRLGYTQAP